MPIGEEERVRIDREFMRILQKVQKVQMGRNMNFREDGNHRVTEIKEKEKPKYLDKDII